MQWKSQEAIHADLQNEVADRQLDQLDCVNIANLPQDWKPSQVRRTNFHHSQI